MRVDAAVRRQGPLTDPQVEAIRHAVAGEPQPSMRAGERPQVAQLITDGLLDGAHKPTDILQDAYPE